jgi:hypothetical protein
MLDTSPHLSVRRWRNHYLIPSSHAAPHRVQQDLDASLTRDVVPALARAARSALPQESGEVVFVRKLDLDYALDAAWDREAIARVTAGALTRSLCHALATDESGNVVRFRSATDYLAAYVAARAAKTGTVPWFFARFDGWSVVPASAAIRSALTADIEQGRAALSSLDATALANVAEALTDGDACALIDALAPASANGAHTFGSVVRLARELAAAPPPARLRRRAAVGIWFLATSATPLPAWPIHMAVLIIRALDDAAGHPGMPSFERLLRMAAEDQQTLAQVAVLAAKGRREHVERFVRTLARRSAAPASSALEPMHRSTRFGGLFLLLDDLFDIDFDNPIAQWPALCETPAVNVVRLAVLALSGGGPDGRNAILDDPYWRDTFSWSPAIGSGTLTRWLEDRAPSGDQFVADGSARILRRFARRLPGFAASSDAYLRGHFLDCAASIDADTDRVVVTLSRVPLDLVLMMSGLNRGERHWPSLDPRPFVLFRGD